MNGSRPDFNHSAGISFVARTQVEVLNVEPLEEYLPPLSECIQIQLLQIIVYFNIIWNLHKDRFIDSSDGPIKHKEKHIKSTPRSHK